MDILSLLKKLKNIEPDKDYTLKSKNLILQKNGPMVWQVLWSNVEFGASLALMVALIYIMLGGFSSWKISAPLQVSNLDPAGLRAEAQAIDVQIRLTNLDYRGGSLDSLKLSESTAVSVSQGKKTAAEDQKTAPQDAKATSTESEAPSIDEALHNLSE